MYECINCLENLVSDHSCGYCRECIANHQPTMKQTIKVRPTKRGIRLWIEGKRLDAAGFVRGAKYTRTLENGLITLRLDGSGNKKVSGKTKPTGDHPIIDITSSKCFDGFEVGQEVEVLYTHRKIFLEAK